MPRWTPVADTKYGSDREASSHPCGIAARLAIVERQLASVAITAMSHQFQNLLNDS